MEVNYDEMSCAEYIWIDGTEPTQKLRSKTKIIETPSDEDDVFDSFPTWGFDGSSTNQASGYSDLKLVPVHAVLDPIRGDANFLVLCEVFDKDGQPHSSNTRAKLKKSYREFDAWFGFEQEYVLLKDGNILGWPSRGYPSPQGPYYCGVGSDEVVGRKIVEEHLQACLHSGLMIGGINAEVMLGQWEFQIGHRGFMNDAKANAFRVSDELWLARWLLYRISEKYDVYATLNPKPKEGDWNGSGMHVNVSYDRLRNKGGKDLFKGLMLYLKKNHNKHMEVYGDGNERRMLGQCETAKADEFSWGLSDRSASVRIPLFTQERGMKGYFEDRRPAANADPYEICRAMMESISEFESDYAK